MSGMITVKMFDCADFGYATDDCAVIWTTGANSSRAILAIREKGQVQNRALAGYIQGVSLA